MKRRIALSALTLACLGALVVAGVRRFARRPSAPTDFVIRSDPSGAFVFESNRELGVAPLRVRVRADERRAFRLVRRGYEDGFLILRAADGLRRSARGGSDPAPPVERVVRLAPLQTSALRVVSDPPGADVILNGALKGRTPLLVSGVAPGEHTVCLAHPDCFDWTGTVRVEPDACAEVRQALHDRIAPLYRAAIEKEPANMNHYLDLAHHLVIRGKPRDAAKVLEEAYDAIKRYRIRKPILYYEELFSIYTRSFKYPQTPETAGLRARSRKLVERAGAEGLLSAESFPKYISKMDAYDKKMEGE